MVAEKVDVIDHFDADTERSQMGSIHLSIATSTDAFAPPLSPQF